MSADKPSSPIVTSDGRVLTEAEVAQRDEMADWIWGLPSKDLLAFVDDLESSPGFAEKPNLPALTRIWREHAQGMAEDERRERAAEASRRYRARRRAERQAVA